MKIKTKHVSPEYALSIKKPAHKRPMKPWLILQALIRILAIPDLFSTRFSYTTERMEEAGDGPWLILMNHSSFIDLKIASRLLFPKPYNIVSTWDGMVGKSWLMRRIGCIPTQKFVSDVSLIMDMIHAIKKNNTSVLMYPEAGYTFDGTSVTLPRKMGTLLKKLNVPVVTIITDGAFLRDPLYNCLQLRKVKAGAHMKCLLTPEEIKAKSVDELDEILDNAFSFDNFATQYEKGVEVKESFRADGLDRILYRCPACNTEGETEGKGTKLICHKCGKEYELTTLGRMAALSGATEFPHIPNWFNWERECVRREIESGEYSAKWDVEIGVLTDYKALYMIGEGQLTHDKDGFKLTGCDGKLNYSQPVSASYSLNADYYWYEKGDVICIGNKDRLYYCFPKGKSIVAKARFAAEEMYKMLHKVTETV